MKHENQERFTRYDYIILALIFFATVFLYTWKVHGEFIGDENRAIWRQLSYGYFDLLPNGLSLTELNNWLVTNANILFQDSHGYCPGLFYGLFFRIADVLSVPFNITTFHLPITLHATLTCFLFYLLLRRSGFNRFEVICGTLLLLIAPIFASNSRAISGSFLIIVPCTQILILFSLQYIFTHGKKHILLGLVLLLIVISDTMFLFSTALTIVCFVLTEIVFNKGTSLVSSFRRAVLELKRKSIWLPPVIVLAISLISTVFKTMFDLRFMTQFERIFSHQSDLPGIFSSINIANISCSFSWLFGQLSLFILPPFILACLFVIKKYDGDRVLWIFSIVFTLAFGFIWYFVFLNAYGTTIEYQIYCLVPLIVLILLFVRTFAKSSRNGTILSYIVMSTLVISSSLTHYGIIWKQGAFLWSMDRTHDVGGVEHTSSITSKSHYGYAWYKNKGFKATSYLIKKLYAGYGEKMSGGVACLYIAQNPDFEVSPIKFFAGLAPNGQKYEKKYGIKTTMEFWERDSLIAMIKENTGQDCSTALNIVLANFSFCDMSASWPLSSLTKSEIYSGEKLLAVILALPPSAGIAKGYLQGGIYQAKELERNFDHEYSDLSDYFHIAM
jgi:hypothetical protein